MAATEACAAPVQEDGVTETKSGAEPAPGPETANNEVVNKETVDKEVVNNDQAASTETGVGDGQPAAADGEETAADDAEQPAEGKAKPAHDGIWDSFLNKSGLGKVMGGKKKRESSAGAEDANAEPQENKTNGEEAEAGAEAGAEDQAIEKAPEGEEAEEGKKEGKEAKPKQGEKSSVRDLIRKPVSRIFSHKSTEKKDGGGAEPQKQITVRSKSLDRMEDPEACAAAADATDATDATEEQAADAQKPSSSSSTKHMKRWHSFKKLMAQRGHKRSSDDPKDTEVAEAEAEAGAGDSSTLDSKGENSGQKRWKLKRSWTFQGLKRDPSVVGISKAAKGSDKDSADAKVEEPTAEDGEQAAAGESEEAAVADGEAEKAEGEDDKGAAAALGAVSQHANEIWTSFKKRVTPKSKKAATESAASVDEDTASAAASVATTADQEQGEEPGAVGKEGKTAKAKRTHFNRAVSLKNFILRKGKSASVEQGDAAPKEGEEEGPAVDGEAETPAGEAKGAQSEGGDQPEAPVANDHAAEGGEEKKQAAPETSAAAEPAAAVAPPPEPAAAPEVTTNGENGCTNGTAEEDAAHNHQSGVEKDEANSTADAKIAAKASQGNAVAQSEKKAGNV